ncbi:MAG: IS21 family transposase, partial [Candidatus Margulisiibacteriota bacterium]
MAKERISMRKIKEVLRLGYEKGLSANQTALCCNLGATTVKEYFRRFKVSGLPWPLPEEITEEGLESKLFPGNPVKATERLPLNYEYLLQEIKRPNVTLALLWEEYKQTHPDGYQYSQFCYLFRKYSKTLNYSMRQEHKAGEKNFADFCVGLNLVDPKTGELIPTQLFVSVWGASTFTFATAVLGEDLANWIGSNVSALEFYGCCPKAIVPDNTKSAVSKACRYEPDINPTYAEFAAHYNLVIFPARPYKPKDKPKAENAVKLAQRWILAKLRNRIFHYLGDMNAAIYELLEPFNGKMMKRPGKSRKELFEILDKPNAQPLPEKRYEFAQWKKVRVNIDYHVCFDDHYYSVPYTLIHQELEIKATRNVIEVFKKGERACSHQRSYHKRKYTTKVEHMPKSHQQYLEWTPTRILERAGKYGASVKELVEGIMNSRKFPEQAYRSCLGIIRLGKIYSAERLDNACRRAISYRIYSYQGVKNILVKSLDKATSDETEKLPLIRHENIRGGEYFFPEKEAPNLPSLKLRQAGYEVNSENACN